MALKSKLNKQEIVNAFVLVIVNENVHRLVHANRYDADRKNIQEFCENNEFILNDISKLKLNDTSNLKFYNNGRLKTEDLTAEEMRNLFLTVFTGDFSAYDAFICFILSHGDGRDVIHGVDGQIITVKEISNRFHNPSLVGKPKLFFLQTSRENIKHTTPMKAEIGFADKYISYRDASNESLQLSIEAGTLVAGSSGGMCMTYKDCKYGSWSMDADILIAYSGYISYRDAKNGSWFIAVLTNLLNKLSCDRPLTDLLTIVNKNMAKLKIPETGVKQMSCFTSTLTKAVYFKPVTSTTK
jgi:hypothetical protein